MPCEAPVTMTVLGSFSIRTPYVESLAAVRPLRLLAAERQHPDEARRTPSAVRACVAHCVLAVMPILDARQRDRALGRYRLVARDAHRHQRLVQFGLVTRHRGRTIFLNMSFA